MTMTKEQAIERLREFFPRGSTVYTVLRHKSRSGMQRTIGVVSILPDTARPDEVCILHPNVATAEACGFRDDRRRDGVKVNGCGMDMGAHIARSIAAACYGDAYALRHEWI